jgi:sec-independent protein translocase protein TatA
MSIAFIGGLGLWEILLILVVALIIFGQRLPDVAKQLGKGFMEFRRGLRNLEDEFEYTDTWPARRELPPPPGPDPGEGDAGTGEEPEKDTPPPGEGPPDPEPRP